MAWNIRSLMMGIVIFSAIAGFMSSFMVDLGTGVNGEPVQEEAQELNQFDGNESINSDVREIKQTISGFEITNPLTWGNAVGLVIDIAGLLFNVPGYVHQIIVSFVTLLGLPETIAFIIETLVLILVVMEVYSSITNYRT